MSTDELFPSYPRKVATISLTYKGVPIALQLADAGTLDIEKAVDGLIGRNGWAIPEKEHTPPQAAPSAPRKPSAPRVEPTYSADGETLCPVHRKPLHSGTYGLYCSCKAREGEQANSKGYCALKFEV